MTNHPEHPVFFDHSGKRWSRIVRSVVGLAFLVSGAGAVFCFSILILPASPLSLGSPTAIRGVIPIFESHEEASRHYVARMTRNKLLKAIKQEGRNAKTPPSASVPNSVVVGFYVNWEPSSFPSLRRHIDDLTYVMPQWLTLGADGDSLRLLYDPKTEDPSVVRLCAAHNVPIIPMLANITNGSFDWRPLGKLLASPASQRVLALRLRDYLLAHHYGGVNLDLEPTYETMKPAEAKRAAKLVHDSLPRFVSTLKDVLGPAHLLLTEDVPPSDTDFDYQRLSDLNDFLVVMLYDQHVPSGDPGPIASQQWVENMAAKLFAQADSSKVVLGLANYCYDWPINVKSNGTWSRAGNGQKLLPDEALDLAGETNAQVQMDDPDRNPHFEYTDESRQDHVVYMLDAATTYNEIMALKGYEPRGAALWYLGSEDPAIWSFFKEGKLGQPVEQSALSNLDFKADVSIDMESQGEMMQIVARPRQGKRVMTKDEDGLIDSERFTQYPSPYVIRRYGKVDKAIALTFDDGPDKTYTPQILDVLRRYHVPATFFIVGSAAEKYPNVVRSCWQQGNEIGNHTFNHPHFDELSPLQAELEVNATQRLIESITGHSSKLFRRPFGQAADVNAVTPADVVNLLEVQNLGYITVGMNIDPDDYERPGADEIVARIDKTLSRGNIILLHDGGGNREQTVAALPQIIQDLRDKGYRFVTVSDLLGPGERERVFPSVTGRQADIAGFDKALFETGFALRRLLQLLFLVSIVFGVARIITVTPLAILQSRRAGKSHGAGFAPPVTVIIPGYNEEAVICRTIRSVLDSDYDDLRVVVVDDGSTDNTTEAVREEFSGEPRVTSIRKENGGKASALNLGIEQADTEIVVCLDADTIFAKDTISLLVRKLADPNVGAVAGNVKVGNRRNAITIWQSIEYIASQNFDRRAYAVLGCVTVVPGAVGAWRKSAILEAGGHRSDTLAEDTDLTFRIRLLGYRIETENRALAFTEAPENIRCLAKQRFRWCYGILQSLWKHRRQTFKPRHGIFSMLVMPAMWINNILFQAFSPVVDIVVVLSLLNHQFGSVLLYYAAFFVLDFISSAIAIGLDGEDFRQLGWLFWQRFFYRQFMYYVIVKSVIAAMKGHAVGWGKLQRQASVTASASEG